MDSETSTDRPLPSKRIEIEERYQQQNARLAIRDVYDAIVELTTNADDRYELLNCDGRVEIEIERRRGAQPSLLRIRDFADGMTSDDMDRKLAHIGGRVSGLERGASVRGTNSRGAKDVAALGRVTFESIAGDGRFHRCVIDRAQFIPYEIQDVTAELRSRVGIAVGTGTLVTVEVGPTFTVPKHETLVSHVAKLVALRDILFDPRRRVTIRDLNRARATDLRPVSHSGKERVKESLRIPGYPAAKAKLVIWRSSKSFAREPHRFRDGGIIVKSRHAVHEATLFDNALETDPHALWFYGKLTCEYLDDLWNDYDDRIENRQDLSAKNPRPVVDPMRKQGLTKDHPFVKALYREALKRLRPLVEEERRLAEGQRSQIENEKTRKRLSKLEAAAAEFMDEKQEEPEASRDPNAPDKSASIKEKGFTLNPPFAQIVVGQSVRFWFNVRQAAFPEISEGADVEIQCLSDEISTDRRRCTLEPHPNEPGVLRTIWSVTGVKPTSATGIRVSSDPISVDAAIEVWERAADKYAGIDALTFERKSYTVRADGKTRKKIQLIAPISMVNGPEPIELSCTSRDFEISGSRTLEPEAKLGIARATLVVRTAKEDAEGRLSATVRGQTAETSLEASLPKGPGITIKIEDISLGNQRFRWRSNVLEIAARHPAVKRYLGPSSQSFPGQEQKHFRVLLAEIVCDAVCSKIIERREAAGFYADDDCDFGFYTAELSRLATEFAPLAHGLIVPEEGA